MDSGRESEKCIDHFSGEFPSLFICWQYCAVTFGNQPKTTRTATKPNKKPAWGANKSIGKLQKVSEGLLKEIDGWCCCPCNDNTSFWIVKQNPKPWN